MAPPIVKRFFVSLNQNKFIGLFVFLLILGGSGVFAMIQKPPAKSFISIGSLAFDTPPPIFTQTGQQIQEQGRIVNEKTLMSSGVMEKVLQKLKIDPQDKEAQNLIQDILDNTKIALPDEAKGQPLIVVGYTNPSKEKGQAIITFLLDSMVEHSEELNKAQLTAKIEAIKERLPEAERELDQAEKNLDNYVRKEGSQILAALDGSLVGRITGSQKQQEDKELALEAVKAQMNSIESKLEMSAIEAKDNAALSADPVVASAQAAILDLERQIQTLEENYLPSYPPLIQLREQLAINEKFLRQRARDVVGNDRVFTLPLEALRVKSSLDPARQQLANQLVGLDTQRETLEKEIETLERIRKDLRQEYEQFPNKQMQQQRLQQEVALKQTFYSQIKSALVDAQAAEVETTGSLTIAEPPATKPGEVKEPLSTPIVIAAGGVIGILAGAGVIFLLATLDARLHTPEEIREKLIEQDVPLLGEIPYISSFAFGQEETAILQELDSPYLAFYERLRSKLRRLSNPSPKMVLITSTSKNEGKTVTTYNLAIASACAGQRTLLIEANLRSDSAAKDLKIIPDPESHLEPLRYYSSQSDCIRLVPEVENLYIVPSAGKQKRAAAIIESSELQRLLAEVKGRFDFIVVDTPSLTSCNDALLLEPLTNGIILATRPGETKGSMLSEALDQLTEAELPLLGVVINDIEQDVPLTQVPPITKPKKELEEVNIDYETSDELEEEETPAETIYR